MTEPKRSHLDAQHLIDMEQANKRWEGMKNFIAFDHSIPFCILLMPINNMIAEPKGSRPDAQHTKDVFDPNKHSRNPLEYIHWQHLAICGQYTEFTCSISDIPLTLSQSISRTHNMFPDLLVECIKQAVLIILNKIRNPGIVVKAHFSVTTHNVQY